MAISIVQGPIFYPNNAALPTGTITLNQPTTAGNTLVVLFADIQAIFGGILPIPPAGWITDGSGDTFTLNPADQDPNETTGTAIGYATGINGGDSSISFNVVGSSPAAWVIELSPCTFDNSVNINSDPEATSEPGPAIPGAGNDVYLVVIESGNSSNPTGMFTAVSAGWTMDARNPSSPSEATSPMAFASRLNQTGSQTPTFTLVNPGVHFYNSSGISFTESAPPPPTTGNIVIQKDTEPSGSSQVFTFTPSWGAVFTLTDGQSHDSGGLNPGTYTINETPIAGWTTVVTGGNPSALVVVAGQTITLTFTNTQTPIPPPPDTCPEPAGCPFDLADGLEALGQRLYDPTHQFWPTDELTRYIVEALRTWNVHALYYRNDFLFSTTQGTIWYDMTDLTQMPQTLRPLTVTDQQLLEVMEYHLLEPITISYPLTWTGSTQFAVEDLQQALERRRNETVSVSGCTISRLLLPALPIARTQLPNRVTELRRVAFIPAAGFGNPSPLFEDDIWALQAFRRPFSVQPFAIPDVYMVSTQPVIASSTGPNMTFDVNVPPGVPGQYEVLVIESGTPPFCATAPSGVTIPDDFTWVLKWGALADLLSRESNAKDVPRAKYCEARYRAGLALLTDSPALLAARIANLPLQIDAVKSADEYRNSWEGLAQSQPDAVYTAGLNLLALTPPPDAGNYSLTLTVLQNAPVPAAPTDCIMVTRDDFDAVLDYAQHLAMFKAGGEEFEATMQLYDRFMKQASLYNSRLREGGQYWPQLATRSQTEANMNPRYSADMEPTK